MLDQRLRERFWAFVEEDPETHCWVWQGRINAKGYSAFGLWGGQVRGHILSYELMVGPVPEGLVVDHLCRNRACINPGHLEPVTNRENILRGKGAAARNARKTECSKGHPFDGVDNRGQRTCSVCARDAQRRHKAKDPERARRQSAAAQRRYYHRKKDRARA